MEFFSPTSNVNFMGIRRYTMAISVVLVLGSILALATRGLNFALDFTGGTLVEVSYSAPMEQADVGKALEAAGFHGAVVQRFDSSNFAIRLAPEREPAEKEPVEDAAQGGLDTRNAALGQRVLEALQTGGNQVVIKRSEFVGPQVGKELAYNGVVAVLVVLTGIMIYIAMRFEWKFAVSTVAGELHDVLITLGFFAVTGMDFDLTVLAAVLAVDGYSVNDKIVVFDRVRENKARHAGEPIDAIVNHSILQTFARSIMTSLTVVLTLLALFLFGGAAISDFILALLIGIVSGTYSSIFVASPILVDWQLWDDRRHGRMIATRAPRVRRSVS